MPELPEVQTITNGLNKKVNDLIIKDVWTDCSKIIKSHSFENFKKEIINKKIINSERIGKNILMHLSGNKTLLMHMKMTGHLLYGKWSKNTDNCHDKKSVWKPENEGPLCDPYNRFIHLLFFLSNGKELAFSDVRKFGKVVLLETDKEFETKDLKKLAPDPLSKNFNLQKLSEYFSKNPNKKIKQVLMDQEIISGIGNIYSDEILWDVGLHPLEKLKNIPEKKIKDILSSAKKILESSIKLGGDSMSDYRNIDGEKGGYQKKHLAYKQTGKPCQKGDGGKIVKIKVGGRSAHYCETHQKLTA